MRASHDTPIPARPAGAAATLRLLICDDSPPAREAVRAMLGDHSEILVVGEAANGEEAVALAHAVRPDVVLMDVAMPVLDGIAATRRIRTLLPTVRVVAFAGSDEAEVVEAMIEAGASAYCVKGSPLWELERAIAGASTPLVRLAHALARSVCGGGTAALVARELADLAGADVAAVYLAAPDVALSLGAKTGPASSVELAAPPGVVRRSFAAAALAWADVGELAELVRLGLPCSEALAVPLLSDGEALGVVFAAMPADLQVRADPELVSSVADLAAAALANERKLALTHAEARRDALTGLPNKRAFDERLAEAVRLESCVALVLLDVDDFKRINDEEGHAVGDEVLRELARVLTRSLRATEEVYRIGGEEFAVVLAGGETRATRVAHRLRTAVLAHRRRRALPTLSAGIACLPGDARTTEELVRRADVALYAAKERGKNQVVKYARELETTPDSDEQAPARGEQVAPPPRAEDKSSRGMRILVVDDDDALRLLLRTTLEAIGVELEEAATAEEARRLLAARAPDVIVLDVVLPGEDGLALSRELRSNPWTRATKIVLLTGDPSVTEAAAEAAGADALVRKPFSPVELLAVVERHLSGVLEECLPPPPRRRPEEQLLLYAHDLRRLLDLERRQRERLQGAYRETVAVLGDALESKDTGTHAHSRRVQRYALELARAVDERLLEDPSVEYGFLLHDIGKIGIPDRVLQKAGPLEWAERRLVEEHAALGAQMLDDVTLLQGEGLRIVRSHHERWDGQGYPDGLAGAEIPLAARVFAVADALDAMTSDRPYREATDWDSAVAEIVREGGHQFDPDVVEILREREPRLRRIHYALAEGPAPPLDETLSAESLDPWAGEDDAWLLAEMALSAGEPDAPIGFGRMLLLAVMAGSLVWAVLGLALYRFLTG